MQKQFNYRYTVLQQLHAAWGKTSDENAEDAIERVKKVMSEHGLKFMNPKDINLSFLLYDITDIPADFFNRVDSPKYDTFGWFAWLCEEYMDFEPVVRKMNEELYSNSAHSSSHKDQHEALRSISEQLGQTG